MNESFNRVLLNKGTAATMIKKKRKKHVILGSNLPLLTHAPKHDVKYTQIDELLISPIKFLLDEQVF